MRKKEAIGEDVRADTGDRLRSAPTRLLRTTEQAPLFQQTIGIRFWRSNGE
jgi:hypothetical protein